MTLLELSEGSRVVFSMPPILFMQICSSCDNMFQSVAEISAIGSGTQRKAVRTDWQYEGQTTETITDKEEGESKT